MNAHGGDNSEAPTSESVDKRTRKEQIDSFRAETYRGTFAPSRTRLHDGDELPAGWEALYFPFNSNFDGLRPDGTPLDDVIPDFGLPRRMYAGEDTVYMRPLQIGDSVERVEKLGEIKEKNGKRGRLVFADIERTYSVEGEPAIETVWHDVFLEDARSEDCNTKDVFVAFPLGEEWSSFNFVPDSRHLFRYSAITFNSHRVHYDRSWATETEDLPDLLVHGPLTRNLLLDAVTGGHSSLRPISFKFIATAPLFVDRAITVAVRSIEMNRTEVVALNDVGALAARGIAAW